MTERDLGQKRRGLLRRWLPRCCCCRPPKGRGTAQQFEPSSLLPSSAISASPAPLPPSGHEPAHVFFTSTSTSTPSTFPATKSCGSMLRSRGAPSKVLLFPDEGWARSAASSYWTIQPLWWWRSRCKVVEVSGARRTSTTARMEETQGGGMHIVGSFTRSTEADFKLHLSAELCPADFNMGYCMTGTLERGSANSNQFQVTHFAVVRRQDLLKKPA